ncbi:hypothetical protein H6P81_019032 [Aristolochia fimbriata]|uniref:LysM domain-containing protein n=1 Tax=Aristolochia fimbriata TaxID=158543 RepID=A0AAV7E776_ARIFI|nr:hypothetical protein H6P81_019032 [Aristolochia fimbriata]
MGRVPASPVAALGFFLLLAAAVTIPGAAAAGNFTCTVSGRCEAIAGYAPLTPTTLSAVKTLFGVKSIRSLLAANSQPPSTPPSSPVPNGTVVRVPFPCRCSGGRGLSDGRRPLYTVRKDDGLDAIARNSFSGLLTSQEIAAANNIPDPNVILVGQVLWIPLPCSCDDVDGLPTVHYAHKVARGSSVEGIATEFGTTPERLMRVNGIQDPRSLQAEAILDVPLRACNSSIERTAEDGWLRVPNGSYALTANNCVQCSCSSTPSWVLQCDPARGVANSTECPAVKCGGGSDLFLGTTTTTTSGDGCGTTCSYAGYARNGTILTALTRPQTCSGGGSSSSSSSSPAGLAAWRWRWVGLGFLSLLIFC